MVKAGAVAVDALEGITLAVDGRTRGGVNDDEGEGTEEEDGGGEADDPVVDDHDGFEVGEAVRDGEAQPGPMGSEERSGDRTSGATRLRAAFVSY